MVLVVTELWCCWDCAVPAMLEHLGMARLAPHPWTVWIGQRPDSIWTKDNLNLVPKLPWTCVREINSRWAQEGGHRRVGTGGMALVLSALDIVAALMLHLIYQWALSNAL